MDKKFELIKYMTKEINGRTLFRIRALSSFNDVHKGDLGGWIEEEENLRHEGNAWVYDNATVYDKAIIYDNAQISNNATVSNQASVSGNAKVYGEAEIFNSVRIYGNAKVYDNAKVHYNVELYDNTEIFGNAKIFGNEVNQYGQIIKLYGNAEYMVIQRYFTQKEISVLNYLYMIMPKYLVMFR
ncbi:MAG TPA: hypothetical protein ACHBYY_02515 [Arsenophonus nasoniae]